MVVRKMLAFVASLNVEESKRNISEIRESGIISIKNIVFSILKAFQECYSFI